MREVFNYPPLLLVLNFVTGILLGKNFSNEFRDLHLAWIVCAVGILILILLRRFFPLIRSVELILFTILSSLLGFATIINTDLRNSKNYIGKYLNNADEKIVVLQIVESLKGNKNFERYVTHVLEVEGHKTNGKVIVNFRKDSIASTKIGSAFMVKVNMQPIQKPKNPYEFDYAGYLENQQIYHQVFLDFDEIQKINQFSETFIIRLQKFRNNLIRKLSKAGISKDEKAVISALLLGERTHLSTELRQSYINAGAIHILAISGLHVGILFMMFSFFLKPLNYFKHGKLISQFIVLLVLWLFAVIAGLSPSVVRAVTMFSFISVGLFLNRKNSVYHSLIASAFLLLLVHPRFLFEVGFQLSYTAVLSIVWIQPKLESLWKPKFKLVNYFWKLLTVSCAAQLGVLPLSLFYFHQFPALFFLSNVVIIPVLGALLGVGLFVLILVEFEIQAEFIVESYSKIIRLLNDFISYIAGFESFVIQNIYWSAGMMVTAYLALILFLKYIEKKTFHRLAFAALVIVGFYMVLFSEVTMQQKQDEILVFHKNRSTMLGKIKGQHLEVFGVSEDEKPVFLTNFTTSKGIDEVRFESELPNFFLVNQEILVVIDSLGLYNYAQVENPIVLLINSPKINLERMIQDVQPRLIIADGSNYRSYVQRWERSCLKSKTPFHDTSQKGAFKLFY